MDFLFLNFILTINFSGGIRYLARWLLIKEDSNLSRVLIYGANDSGIQLRSAISHSPEFKVVGFIDDNNDFVGNFIEGLRIYSRSDLDRIIDNLNVSEIFIAKPDDSKSRIQEIINDLKGYSVVIRVMPNFIDIAKGELSVNDLKKVKISDLLKREQRKPIQKLLEKDITGKNVLITGAGGSIGSELSSQILEYKPNRLVLFDISEFSLYQAEQQLSMSTGNTSIITIIGNVNNQGRLEKIFEKYDINTVYHAAAYKHVPLVEKNIVAGVRCNIFGTLSCISASIRMNIDSFVFISTDKAVRPTNIMGATKRFAEQILQSIYQNDLFEKEIKTRISIVRFGNVLGSSGSVVPLFRKQIKNGGPLTVTDPNIIRYFMTPQEASQLVIQAGAMGKMGDIFLLDMGDPVKVHELAKDMIQLSGKSVKDIENPDGDIEIKFTGLRPGEKLYEELLIDSKSESTEHEKIFIAKDESRSWDQMKIFLEKLTSAIEGEDQREIKNIFLDAVDGYNPKSNN
ncbi:polysaccharide biosynthesis protein [Gammaproteobacteria bacterium]|nr:polysaccharide biosynthesis protein [Gammaproteobacteria bacterium]